MWRTESTGPGHVVATRPDVVLCRLLARPTPEVLAELRRAITSNDTPVAVIVVVAAGAELPDGETRRRATRLMKTCADSIDAWVVILEGGGFLRSAMRSVGNTVRVLARPGFPLNIVDTPNAAADWLATNSKVQLTAAELGWPKAKLG